MKQYVNFLIDIGEEPNLYTVQQAGNSILRAELVVRFVFLVKTSLKIDSLEINNSTRQFVGRLLQLKERQCILLQLSNSISVLHKTIHTTWTKLAFELDN